MTEMYARDLRVIGEETGERYWVHDGGGHATVAWNGEAWDTYEPDGDLVDDEAVSGRETALEVIRAILGDPQPASEWEVYTLGRLIELGWMSGGSNADEDTALANLTLLGLAVQVEQDRRQVYRPTELGVAKAAML